MNIKKMTMGALSAAMVAFGAGNAAADAKYYGDYVFFPDSFEITSYNGTDSIVRIPASFEDVPVKAIGDLAFSGRGLTSVTIPEGVELIGVGAFQGCSVLTSVTIPSTVTSIADNAFDYFDFGLGPWMDVTVLAINPPELGEDVFLGRPCIIYVPAESVDAYKNADGWDIYAQQIRPISNGLKPAAVAAIAIGSAAVVGVGGHFIGEAVSQAIGQKKGHPTYKLVKQMTLSVPDFDAKGYTYKNKLIYHPAKGTLTGRIILEVQKGERTVKIRAKATGAYQEDGTFVGTLDAKGYGKHGFILGIAD